MDESSRPFRLQRDGDDVLIFIKAVPGASRDEIAGLVGDRLKVRISTLPERGKANKAICALIAKTLGIKSREVMIESGQNSAEKAVRVCGVDVTTITKLMK